MLEWLRDKIRRDATIPGSFVSEVLRNWLVVVVVLLLVIAFIFTIFNNYTGL